MLGKYPVLDLRGHVTKGSKTFPFKFTYENDIVVLKNAAKKCRKGIATKMSLRSLRRDEDGLREVLEESAYVRIWQQR
jgi:hypothetical protein